MIFAHFTPVLATRRGFTTADDSSWNIREYDVHGRLERSIRRAAPPTPATSNAIAAYRKAFESAISKQPGLPPQARSELVAQVRDAPSAETIPVFDDVIHGSDGSYWLSRYDPTQAFDFESHSVIDSTGRYLGDIPMPKGEHLVAVTRAEIYTVGTTPTGGPVLSRRPIVR